MQINSLQAQKKELQQLNSSELVELCLRLGRYKKENKELLNYLLFYQHDPAGYVEEFKILLQSDFDQLNRQNYYAAKSLRKILRNISRQAKYLAIVELETDLLLWFCNNYLERVDLKNTTKALQNIFIRQVEKIGKLISKMQEDLQFDYQQELNKLHNLASKQASWYSL